MKINSALWIALAGLIPAAQSGCSGQLVVEKTTAATDGGATGGVTGVGGVAPGGAYPGGGGGVENAGEGGVAPGGAYPGGGGGVGNAGEGGVATGGVYPGGGGGVGNAGAGGFGAYAASGGISAGGTIGLGGVSAGDGAGPPATIPDGTSLCGGVQCSASEDCCLLTAKCFDPKDSSACPTPPPDNDPQGRATCASNSDCSSDQFCILNDVVGAPSALCTGAGHCDSRTNCDSTSARNFCGCDGLTYADLQSACLAGVRISTEGPCALPVQLGGGGAPGTQPLVEIPCGSDTQCLSGTKCCAITGVCYDTTKPALCTTPPAGTTRSCYTSADCIGGAEYCAGTGCDAPGGCKPLGSTSCSPVLHAVCGCDGQNYVNADCAEFAGIRVSHDGECSDAAAP